MYTVENIKNINVIKTVDMSDFVEGMDNNGGHYSYWTEYTRTADDVWEMTEHTSGEFCPYCGSWDCSGECSPEAERIYTEDLVVILNSFVEDEDHYIEME